MIDVIVPKFTIADRVRHVDGFPQVRRDGTTKVASKAYRTTDPERLAHQLDAAGCRVLQAATLYGSTRPWGAPVKRSKWRIGLEVEFPEAYEEVVGNGHYRPRARILCDHAGRQALHIALGELRMECCNQFTMSEIKVRHTDPEIDYVLDRPFEYILAAYQAQGATARQIEGWQDVQIPDEKIWAIQSRPRLWNAYLVGIDQTRVQEGMARWPMAHSEGRERNGWMVLQALTRTRQPRLVAAAAALIKGDDEAYYKLFNLN